MQAMQLKTNQRSNEMSNPFPTRTGFGLRVFYAVNAIRELGRNPLSAPAYDRVHNNRRFDNCFESYDGDAVVYAIMAKVHEEGDRQLAKGIKLMGEHLWQDWDKHYRQSKKRQLSLF